MKKAIYILICLLWMSCANETKYRTESVEIDLEDISAEEDDYMMELQPINYEGLAKQKLIDYFELLRLKQKHPEFEKDIILQLQGFSKDSESPMKDDKIDSIKNIRQFGTVMRESDSITKIMLYYDIVSHDAIKRDSILAIISTKSVFMDDVMIPTMKVSFRKIK